MLLLLVHQKIVLFFYHSKLVPDLLGHYVIDLYQNTVLIPVLIFFSYKEFELAYANAIIKSLNTIALPV